MEQTNMPSTPRGNVRLFGCGGAGINISSVLENFRNHNEKGMALIDTVYVDTSMSNLKAHLPEDKIYIARSGDKTDGSGKERGQNAEHIMKHAKDILQKHKPGYVNVLVSSLSGGSGAVISAALTNELMQQGEMMIVIAVGVADSGTEINNTQKALATFEGLVKAHGKSLVVAYFENSKDTPASVVDANVMELITAIGVMFSRQNEGLDTRDMFNFLNVDKLTAHKPQVASLESYAGTLVKEDHLDTITVASAVVEQDNRGIDFILPYTTYGVMPADIDLDLSKKEQIHLVTKAYPFNKINRRLKDYMEEMERAANASTAQSELLAGGEKLEGGFLML